MSITDEETQNLHIATPAQPDQNWSRMQPMYVQPSKERLDRKHQLVQVKNTSDTVVTARGRPVPQKHIVIDRYNQGHELQAGEQKEVDMLVDDIAYFIRERKAGRHDHLNRPKPMHPIQIVGFDESQPPADEQQPQPQMAAATQQRAGGRERTVKGE